MYNARHNFRSSRSGRKYQPNSGSGFVSGNRRFSRGKKLGILDTSLLIRPADTGQAEAVYHPINNFIELDIADQLKQNILSHGYTTPTPIQDQAIPYVLTGKDVVGIANTGTGKTAAFLVPLINKIYADKTQRVLIVAPTRELAVQIQEECREFAKGMHISSQLCIGGVSINPQLRGLRNRTDIIIGTPGRLKDLETRRALNFGSFNNIVLDEVDRMLDMGFIHDVRYIISKLPVNRQSLFFSATMAREVESVMRAFLNNPVTVSVKSRESSANVDQDVVKLDGRLKVDLLHDLLVSDGFDKVLVFGRTKWGIEKLSKELERRGFDVAALHGNKSHSQRQKALAEFKGGRIKILLATDVASRGLDIADVSHVINYDLPETYEDYVHRIGRTGRANKKGVALSFVD
jgi:ATP-dependent RNA helicase RhlE